VVVRSLLTLVVVWLLRFPGLLFLGGAMLVWIAYKLLIPEQERGDGPQIKATNTFWGAIRTIVVGVAGAAHGSFLLVVLGLLISIPVLVWGSSILLRYVERFPALVYLGAGVLAFTAVKMMTAEPLVHAALAPQAALLPLTYGVTVLGVLWAGFVENHRRLESRIHARLASLRQQRNTASDASSEPKGDTTVHMAVGNKAQATTKTARRMGCDHIVMGTARKNSLTRMLEASTTNRVLELTTVPVEIIAGDAVSTLERFGIPVGISALAAWLLFALAD